MIGVPTAERTPPRGRRHRAGRRHRRSFPSGPRGRSGIRAGGVLPLEFRPAADGKALPRTGDDGRRTVRLVAGQVRQIDEKQPPVLLGDRGECLLRGRPGGDERGYPSQRRLLLGEAAQLRRAVGVRDRGRDQLGERGQARLGIARQQLLAAERHDDAAPQPALGADRHADGGAHPPVPGDDLAHHPGDFAVIDPGGRAGLVHQRGRVPAAAVRRWTQPCRRSKPPCVLSTAGFCITRRVSGLSVVLIYSNGSAVSRRSTG